MSDSKPPAKWVPYIERTKKKTTLFPLYYMSKLLWWQKKGKLNALSLGTGAGVEANLINYGWHVTGVDIEPHSKKVVLSQIKSKKGKFAFINASFDDMKLTGMFNYVMAFNSIPFSSKKNFSNLIKLIVGHMNSEAVIAINMFGNKHSFVLSKTCFGITKTELKKILNTNKLTVHYLEQTLSTRKKGDQWDVIDVIATLD